MSDAQIDATVFSEAKAQVERLRSQLRETGTALENLQAAESTLKEIAGGLHHSAEAFDKLLDHVHQIVQKLHEFLPDEVQQTLRETRTEVASVGTRLGAVEVLAANLQQQGAQLGQNVEALMARRATGTMLVLMLWTLLLAAGVVAWIELQPLTGR